VPDATLDLLLRTEDDPRRRLLLRGGYVLSMDPEAGEFVGDVVIEGDTVAAIGPGAGGAGRFDGVEIDLTGAIVMPGLVDSHFHGWQAALAGLVPDVTLPEYMATIHGAYYGPPGPPGLAAHYEPEDMRLGNLVTSLRMLETGVTCFVDNCHNVRSPEHASAAVEGLRAGGIRAVHATGAPIDGRATPGWPGDVLTLRDEYFGGGEELLTLRLFAVPDEELWRFAGEHGLWLSVEAGGWVEADLRRIHAAGLMTSGQTYNHASGFSEEMWGLIADVGATVNVSPRSDTTYLVETAVPPLAEAMEHGVPVGISMDTEVGYAVDFFAEMRTMLHLARGRSAPLVPGEEPSPPLVGAAEMLRLATLGGAANADLAGRVGSLAPGHAADVTVIRPGGLELDPPGNLAGAVVSRATPADVEAVLVAGGVRKWAGQLVGHDLDALLSQLSGSRERILASFGAPLDPFDSRFWS
jgi:5-methylthioadenosine/S-adenosylhomocysteine deaminase